MGFAGWHRCCGSGGTRRDRYVSGNFHHGGDHRRSVHRCADKHAYRREEKKAHKADSKLSLIGSSGFRAGNRANVMPVCGEATLGDYTAEARLPGGGQALRSQRSSNKDITLNKFSANSVSPVVNILSQ